MQYVCHRAIPKLEYICDIMYCTLIWYLYLTIAHKSTRVWGPGTMYYYSIRCTICPHPPSWNIPWGTHEEYLCTNQWALVHLNKAIPRASGHPTVDWKEESGSSEEGYDNNRLLQVHYLYILQAYQKYSKINASIQSLVT